MIGEPRQRLSAGRLWTWAALAAVLPGAALLRSGVLWRWLVLPAIDIGVGIGTVILLRWPSLSLMALVLAALAVPLESGTGTDVPLNLGTLLMAGPPVLSLVMRLHRGQPAHNPRQVVKARYDWPHMRASSGDLFAEA
ncbi:MAG: hypothetical protein ACOC6F_00340 [bacterium]